jgi:hypothetical protein
MKRIKDQSHDQGNSPDKTSESIFALSTDLATQKRKNITINFAPKKNGNISNAKLEMIPISSKIKGAIQKLKSGTQVSSSNTNQFTCCIWDFDFFNHRCTQYNDSGVALGNSISYSLMRPLILFNNYGYFSILRLDTKNKIHFLEKVNNQKRSFCSSAGFFKKRFENFTSISYFGKVSELYDIEKRSSFSKFNTMNCSYSSGSGNDAIFYETGIIQIFDIRTPFKSNKILSIAVGDPGKYIQCLDINKEEHSLLVSLDTGCVYYDLRKDNTQNKCDRLGSNNDVSIFSNTNTSPFQVNEEETELSNFKSKTKNWLINSQRGFVADFMERTLNLYNFSSGKIEKSLHFPQNLLDVSIQVEIGRIATLVSSKADSEYELTLFDLDLYNQETLDLSQQSPDNLGFIGSNGLLLTQGRGHFNVFNALNTQLEASLQSFFNYV